MGVHSIMALHCGGNAARGIAVGDAGKRVSWAIEKRASGLHLSKWVMGNGNGSFGYNQWAALAQLPSAGAKRAVGENDGSMKRAHVFFASARVRRAVGERLGPLT